MEEKFAAAGRGGEVGSVADADHISHKTLGPVHVWALGVGIVLVGEFMGWYLTI